MSKTFPNGGSYWVWHSFWWLPLDEADVELALNQGRRVYWIASGDEEPPF